jgi:hypothetical protein
MFDRNVRAVTVDSSVLEAEDAARRTREHDDLVAANRRRQLAWDTEQRDREQRRHQLEVDATTAKQEAAHRQIAAQQSAQWAWAKRRADLRDHVATLRSAVQSAQSTVDNAPLHEATAAAAALVVHERRLKQAETEYANHPKTSAF